MQVNKTEFWEQVKDWPALPEVTAVKRGITLDDLFDSIV